MATVRHRLAGLIRSNFDIVSPLCSHYGSAAANFATQDRGATSISTSYIPSVHMTCRMPIESLSRSDAQPPSMHPALLAALQQDERSDHASPIRKRTYIAAQTRALGRVRFAAIRSENQLLHPLVTHSGEVRRIDRSLCEECGQHEQTIDSQRRSPASRPYASGLFH
jgi:hypothetical protein